MFTVLIMLQTGLTINSVWKSEGVPMSDLQVVNANLQMSRQSPLEKPTWLCGRKQHITPTIPAF